MNSKKGRKPRCKDLKEMLDPTQLQLQVAVIVLVFDTRVGNNKAGDWKEW